MESSDAVAIELRKISNLLALMYTADLKKGEKARVLNSCGFSNRDISTLVESSEASVRALLSQGRKGTAAPDE